MDRRSVILTLAGGVVAASAFGTSAAFAAPAGSAGMMTSTADIRSALGEPTEMQWRRRGWGRRRWGGGWGRRRWGGGWGWRRRRFWGGGPRWGWRRRYWARPGWRRCWINRWGERVCRRPVW